MPSGDATSGEEPVAGVTKPGAVSSVTTVAAPGALDTCDAPSVPRDANDGKPDVGTSPSSSKNDILSTFVRSAVEQILEKAPWTFNKVNTLKDACRVFLDACVVSGASSGSARGITIDDGKLTELALDAILNALKSGKLNLINPALNAAHKLIASGTLAGGDVGATSPTRDADAAKSATNTSSITTTSDTSSEASSLPAQLIDAVVECSFVVQLGETSAGGIETLTNVIGVLLQSAVSDPFHLTGTPLQKILSTVLRLSAKATDQTIRQTAKTATTQIINTVFKRAGFVETKEVSRLNTHANEPGITGERTGMSLEPLPPPHHDALVVLLTLCERVSFPEKVAEAEKVSVAASNAGDPFHAISTAFTPAAAAFVQSETRNARTRAVALDMLRQLLDGPGSGVWLETLAPFLRKPMRVALAAGVDTEGGYSSNDLSSGSQNSATRPNAPAVARADPATASTASLARVAFTSLTLRARHAYKYEIAKLFPKMALGPLEPGGASAGASNKTTSSTQLVTSHKSKLAALRVIRSLSSDPQVLVDIFVNYDCDAYGENLYERTVQALATTMAPGSGERQKFRDAAVQCVLAVVQSLRAWHARGDVKGGVNNSEEKNTSSAAVSPDQGMELTPSGGAHRGGDEKSLGDESATNASEQNMGRASPVSHPSVTTESEKFATLKRRKASIEASVANFNLKATVVTLGRLMEFHQGLVEGSASTPGIDTTDESFPKRAALFLKTQSAADGSKRNASSKHAKHNSLDPIAIGELLGSNDVDSLRVMKEFTDLFDFAGVSFDDALRTFVSPFRVPGEAQKIDRLMERFALRFCECNPEAFGDTDQAYVLAFAVVMLNTDAHNSKTDEKMKMTEDAFVEMARSGMKVDVGEGNGSFFEEVKGNSAATPTTSSYADESSLRSLYRRVVSNEIKMSSGHDELSANDGDDEDDDDETNVMETLAGLTLERTSSTGASVNQRKSKLDTAEAETKAVLRKTRDLFSEDKTSSESKSSTFHAASEPGLARPMLETAGAALLRAVSRAFSNAEDAAHAALPLEGARVTLQLASKLNLPTLRDALCDFLAKAPGVGGDPRGTSRHGLEATKTLLQLAAGDISGVSGSNNSQNTNNNSNNSVLGEDNWPLVLEVVSRLDALRFAVEMADASQTETQQLHTPTTQVESRGFEVDDLFARYLSDDATHEADDTTNDTTHGNRSSVPPMSQESLALLTASIRAPLRFTKAPDSKYVVSNFAGAVSVLGHVTKTPPVVLTPADHLLGRWLSSDEGKAKTQSVCANTNKFDDVEATGFVAALAGVAVADVWDDARSTHPGSNVANNADASNVDPATVAQIAAMPLPASYPRFFAVTKLAEVTCLEMERPRLVRGDIWIQRVAPVLAGMAAHSDLNIVKAAADGLFVTSVRFAERAKSSGSSAAAAAAFKPFADAHRWAALADVRAKTKLVGSHTQLDVALAQSSSLIARRLAAASAGLCVSSFGKENSTSDASLTPLAQHELAGFRAGLRSLVQFASDNDDTVASAALSEGCVDAIAEATGRVIGAAVGVEVSVDTTQTDTEVVFANDVVTALAAFAARGGGVPGNDGSVKTNQAAASFAAVNGLRSVAIAVADARVINHTKTNAGEHAWRLCLDALSTAAARDNLEGDEGALFSTHAIEQAFCVLSHSTSSTFPQSVWDSVLDSVAKATLDADNRVQKTSSSKTTWETTSRRAVEWCVLRAPVCLAYTVKLLRKKGPLGILTRLRVLGSSENSERKAFPYAYLPSLVTNAVTAGDADLVRTVGMAVVKIAETLALTHDVDEGVDELEGDDKHSKTLPVDRKALRVARQETWLGLVRCLEVAATSGVSAATDFSKSKASKSRPDTHTKSKHVSSQACGAVAADVACTSAARILVDNKELANVRVPVGTRDALLDVLARAHAGASKANTVSLESVLDASTKPNTSADYVVRVETEVGCLLLRALEFETNASDDSVRKQKYADRLGATAVAILDAAVAISNLPPFEGESMGNQSVTNGDSPSPKPIDMAWFASCSVRRDALVFRELLISEALNALVNLRTIDQKIYAKRAARATSSAAALVKVNTKPTVLAVGNFFAQIALCDTWSFHGTAFDRGDGDVVEVIEVKEVETEEVETERVDAPENVNAPEHFDIEVDTEVDSTTAVDTAFGTDAATPGALPSSGMGTGTGGRGGRRKSGNKKGK